MFRILLGVLGVVGLVVAASLLFGGGSLLVLESELTDETGFIESAPLGVEADGYAVVAGPAQIDLAPDLPVELGEIASLRIRATSTDPSRGLFVGVAEAAAVDAYLGGVPYAFVENLDADSFALTYRVDASGELPGPPGEGAFWTASTQGMGTQELEWEVEAGQVAFVIMNEDATDGVSFEAVVGVRIPLLRPIAKGLLVGGGAALAVGTILLVLAL